MIAPSAQESTIQEEVLGTSDVEVYKIEDAAEVCLATEVRKRYDLRALRSLQLPPDMKVCLNNLGRVRTEKGYVYRSQFIRDDKHGIPVSMMMKMLYSW